MLLSNATCYFQYYPCYYPIQPVLLSDIICICSTCHTSLSILTEDLVVNLCRTYNLCSCYLPLCTIWKLCYNHYYPVSSVCCKYYEVKLFVIIACKFRPLSSKDSQYFFSPNFNNWQNVSRSLEDLVPSNLIPDIERSYFQTFKVSQWGIKIIRRILWSYCCPSWLFLAHFSSNIDL